MNERTNIFESCPLPWEASGATARCWTSPGIGLLLFRGFQHDPGVATESQIIAEVVRRVNAYDALVAALELALPMLADAAKPSETYGLCPAGDPRVFTPDQENTPKELEAHRLACEAWDRGENPEHAASGIAGNVCIDVSPFGYGSYIFRWQEYEDAHNAAVAALAKAKGEA